MFARTTTRDAGRKDLNVFETSPWSPTAPVEASFLFRAAVDARHYHRIVVSKTIPPARHPKKMPSVVAEMSGLRAHSVLYNPSSVMKVTPTHSMHMRSRSILKSMKSFPSTETTLCPPNITFPLRTGSALPVPGWIGQFVSRLYSTQTLPALSSLARQLLLQF